MLEHQLLEQEQLLLDRLRYLNQVQHLNSKQLLMAINIILALHTILLPLDILPEALKYLAHQRPVPKPLEYSNNSIISSTIQVNTKLSNMNNKDKCSIYKICNVIMETIITIWVLQLLLVLWALG